ncbi:LAQU0S07e05006g1_1 [Lachancea quebecensis]|uniref:LAQU0S07e05006g1_1 n=1 Tax=Lachancea quebecensis TaxID=1654605 RepID=A0A0P1KT69_9SACH|nr:LAQU0S07e05006g1_1 [Lachancea quebecensis]
MSETVAIYPFETTIFFKPENSEFTSQNLWESLKEEHIQHLGLNDEQQEVLGNIPRDTVIHNFERFPDCIRCKCSIQCASPVEPTVIFETPLERRLSTQESRRLMEISSTLGVEVVVASTQIYSTSSNSLKQRHLYVLGLESLVAAATPQVLAFLALLKEKFVQYTKIESPVLLPSCVGYDQLNIQNIFDIYKTEVVVPQLWLQDPSDIILIGEVHSLVLMAKEKLEQMVGVARRNILCSSIHNIPEAKLHYLKTFCRNQFTEIMTKYQCYVKINKSSVDFVAGSVQVLEQTMKQLTLELLMTVYEVQIIIHDQEGNVVQGNLNSKLHELAFQNQVIILQLMPNAMNYVIVGSPENVNKCIDSLEKERFKEEVQIRFLVELHPDYKEFISGKKNGKMSKIIESAKCAVSLELREDQSNMNIVLTSDSFAAAKIGIRLLSDELPAEDSFFIPDSYHRPVIGTGGSVIQTIMRRYNVFIQFSNTYQVPYINIGFTRRDNVVIRCPHKNQKSISQARDELMRLVSEYSERQARTFVSLSPGQYRHCFLQSSNFMQDVVSDLEKRIGVYIKFPTTCPTKRATFEVRGDEQNSVNAAKELAKRFALEREITADAEITDVEDFINKLAVPLKSGFDIETSVNGSMVTLTYSEAKAPLIRKARDIIRAYFSSKGILVVAEKDLDQNSALETRHNPKQEIIAGPIYPNVMAL